MPGKLRPFLWIAALAGLGLSGCAGAYTTGNGAGNSRGTGTPSAPNGLQASPGNSLVNIAWSASASAAGYYVKRSTTTGGPYTQIAGTTSINYTDSAVTNGTKYFYVVSAYNSAGQSGNSPEVSVTPAASVVIPPVPSGLQAT